mgnify:CR=1 FL=1
MQPATLDMIDWLSWSILTDEPLINEHLPDTCHRARKAAAWTLKLLPELHPTSANLTHGRKPYRFASGLPYARLLLSEGQAHVTVELTGQGCAMARGRGIMSKLLVLASERCTRIDLVRDMETDLQPGEFVAAGYSDKFRARQSIVSDSGLTEYVGSPKSERFARVYRYAEPHPRAHLLRVEMVMKGENAREYVKFARQNSVGAAVSAAGAVYGWKHPYWPNDGAEPLTAARVDTQAGGTVRWFYKQVAPAVRRLLEDGTLTPDDLISEFGLTANEE